MTSDPFIIGITLILGGGLFGYLLGRLPEKFVYGLLLVFIALALYLVSQEL